eukprot:3859235-Prymnesium_polylepis.1
MSNVRSVQRATKASAISRACFSVRSCARHAPCGDGPSTSVEVPDVATRQWRTQVQVVRAEKGVGLVHREALGKLVPLMFRRR